MKVFDVLLLLSAILCQTLSESTISTLVDHSLRFDPSILSRPYYRYNAESTIIMGNETQSAAYSVCFYPDPTLSDESSQYYIGWVEGYKASDGTESQGYGNTNLASQPVFVAGEDRTTGKVTTIKFS